MSSLAEFSGLLLTLTQNVNHLSRSTTRRRFLDDTLIISISPIATVSCVVSTRVYRFSNLLTPYVSQIECVCVVCQLMKFVEVFWELRLWKEMPPFAPVRHNVNHLVAVFVVFPVPAKSAIVIKRVENPSFFESRDIPEARLLRNCTQTCK